MPSDASSSPPPPAAAIAAEPVPLLFFDGDCGLCNRIVRVLLRLDRRGRLRFAPLQGRAGQGYLTAHELPIFDFETLIFVPDWNRRDEPDYLTRTDGVVAALRVVGGFLPRLLAGFLALFPPAARDAGYRFVARSRYRVFGPWRPRPLPRPEWKARFLDPLPEE